MSKRRVVVTGLGLISPVGNTVESAWSNLINGISGIRLIDDFDTTDFRTKFAGTISNFDVAQYLPLTEARKFDLFIQYGIAASVQAIQHAGFTPDELERIDLERVGVCMGSGIGGLGTIEANHSTLVNSGPKRISPFFIPASIVNMTAGYVSIMYGFKGPNLALATACTTGTHCIGLGFRSIQYGETDVMIVGGSEKASTPIGIGGFAAARALSSRNDGPAQASRPWDKERDGFVLGDGAGCMVLEAYEHALARNANIIAEVVGFGMSGDAYHITRPSGRGATTAMRLALKDANLNPEALHYINAHATSTQVGDLEESNSIKSLMGEHAYRVAISSTKSMTGHLLGAAGAVEAIISVLAIRDQVVPPTINLDNPGEGCDLDYVANTARNIKVEATLSNSFGFGGTNGSLVFRKI